jgi:hypothetical protein
MWSREQDAAAASHTDEITTTALKRCDALRSPRL